MTTGYVGPNGQWVSAADQPASRQIAPLNYAGIIPQGLSWLTDLPDGFDIYSKGFTRTPTIFFDPTASTSRQLGTYQQPYTSLADVMLRCRGDMSGQTLGFKRGTTTRHSNFVLTVSGTPGAPFTICPYGDAAQLPIITTGLITLGWALVDGPNNIWSKAFAQEYDAFQSGVRVPKKAWAGTAAGTLTAAGLSSYNGGTLYLRPFAGENPNAGQVEVQSTDAALLINYNDVAATGNITICGLDLQKARNSVLNVTYGTKVNITSLTGITLVGNKVSGAGTDGPALGCDGIVHYGVTDAIRSQAPYIAGNYATDCLNNAVEISGTTGAIIEFNQSYGVGGNSIAELWSSNSNAVVRYNRGELSSTYGRVNTGYAKAGIWFANNYWDGATWDTNDATNAKNANNKALFNIVLNPGGACFQAGGGTGHLMAHNTAYIDHDVIYPVTDLINTNRPAGLYTDGTAASGFLTFSNNLIYYKDSKNQAGYLNPSLVLLSAGGALGASASVPSGNNNVYMHQTGTGTANWKAGSSFTDMPSYKTAVAAYSLDQASKANSALGYGGGLSISQLGFNETTLRPLAANIPGITTLTGIGTMYADGQAYDAASCTIGALRGT